ncbi:MAG: hypothetical protein IT236_04290 [Bacteroidia bacterium]|nr:hypothetical protein [Bacteroidia bacterium]
MKTILQIMEDVGGVCPFAVRQRNWPPALYVVIIKCYAKSISAQELILGFPYKNGLPFTQYSQASKREDGRLILSTDFTVPRANAAIWDLRNDINLDNFRPAKILDLSTVFTFGKHLSKSVEEMLYCDFGYFNWLTNNKEDIAFNRQVIQYIDQFFSGKLSDNLRELNEKKLTMIESGLISEFSTDTSINMDESYWNERILKESDGEEELFVPTSNGLISHKALAEELKKREMELEKLRKQK